jgi:hypothetical protein
MQGALTGAHFAELRAVDRAHEFQTFQANSVIYVVKSVFLHPNSMNCYFIAFSCIDIVLRFELAEIVIFEFSLCRQALQLPFVANQN